MIKCPRSPKVHLVLRVLGKCSEIISWIGVGRKIQGVHFHACMNDLNRAKFGNYNLFMYNLCPRRPLTALRAFLFPSHRLRTPNGSFALGSRSTTIFDTAIWCSHLFISPLQDLAIFCAADNCPCAGGRIYHGCCGSIHRKMVWHIPAHDVSDTIYHYVVKDIKARFSTIIENYLRWRHQGNSERRNWLAILQDWADPREEFEPVSFKIVLEFSIY
jgi:hypothetical protein